MVEDRMCQVGHPIAWKVLMIVTRTSSSIFSQTESSLKAPAQAQPSPKKGPSDVATYEQFDTKWSGEIMQQQAENTWTPSSPIEKF